MPPRSESGQASAATAARGGTFGRPMIAAAEILPQERECHDCGLFQTLPELASGEAATCRRCHAVLRHGRRNTQNRALACAGAALFLFAVAVQLPIMDVRAIGRTLHATLLTGPELLGDRFGMAEIGFLVVLTLVIMPAAYLVLLLAVLLGVRSRNPPRILPRLFGWVERARPWAMIEVFLLGSFVAYTRLKAIASVDVGPALLALGGTMLCLIAADVALDHEEVWEAMRHRHILDLDVPPGVHRRIGCDTCRLVLRAPVGYPCPRCGTKLRRRKPRSIVTTWALIATAAVLYLPANFYPVLTVIRFGQGSPSTILGGVVELLDAGMYPLAGLVFLASVAVPLLKLAGLAIMLVATQNGSVTRLRDRTRLYRLIEFVGRWSMIDVFMVSLLVALVRLGFVASVAPGPGVIAFAAVVVLTMFASASFDPRLMWDAARAAGHDLETEDVDRAPPRRFRRFPVLGGRAA